MTDLSRSEIGARMVLGAIIFDRKLFQIGNLPLFAF